MTCWLGGYFSCKHKKCQRKVKVPLLITLQPNPPQLKANFSWSGKYLVPDLSVTVSFIWFGKDGNTQMIAGRDGDIIHFTNLIHQNKFYTYTYAWPGLQPPFLPPLEPCNPIPLTLEQVNGFLAQNSRFIGREILEGTISRQVNHFRVALALPRRPSGSYFRLPITCVDIYSDVKDSTLFWKVLQFGLQNLYDPELNEYIVIENIQDKIPDIVLPPACVTLQNSNQT